MDFCGSIDISNSLHVELFAIYHGLGLTWDMGFRSVLCYSYSQVALHLITRSDPQLHCYASLIHDIQDKLRLHWSVLVERTLREGNQCTDFLAKMGASQDDRFKVIDTPPHVLSSLLFADVTGVAFLWLQLLFFLFALFSSIYQKKF